MNLSEYNLKKFSALKGIQIVRERDVQYGKQFTLNSLGDTVHITLYPKTNLIQGKESKLKEIISAWGENSEPYDGGVKADLPSGWREWNEEANWILDFHKKYGIPKEEDLNHRYMIRREVLFHDYMFRNGTLDAIPFDKFEMLVRAWYKRNCFMNHNVDGIISSLKEKVQNSNYIFDVSLKSIPFSIAVDLLADEQAGNCPIKFLKNGVCPQTNELHFDCTVDIADALYPYFTDKVLSYTKGNLNKLIKRDYSLKWTSIAPSTPIEEKMSESLLDAGLLTIPQYQAWDEKHRYNLDFIIKTPQGVNIAVECDGLQYHARPSTYIHDRKRDRYLQSKGFYVMRFSSVEIYNEMDTILTEIDEAYWKIQKKRIDLRTPYRISYFGYGDEE